MPANKHLKNARIYALEMKIVFISFSMTTVGVVFTVIAVS
jgi:hypothetical protein